MVKRLALVALSLLVSCGDGSSFESNKPGLADAESPGVQVLKLTSGGAITNAADMARTGWYPDQPLLAPTTVGGSTFRQNFSTAVNGQVYAQPLVSGDVVFVATETNNVYAIDAVTGAIRASRNFGTPFNPQDLACGDLLPFVGITGTPVIDASTNTAYFFAKSYVSGSTGPSVWKAHAVDVATLADRSGFPVTIAGAASNDPTATFNPSRAHQRPGLLLLNGVVYAGFGAHCDVGPYRGWVAGVTTSGQLQTLWTTESGTTNPSPGAAIWQSGGGLVSDGPGRIIFATANGLSPSNPLPGSPVPNQLGEAVVRLQVQSNGSLQPMDFFIPSDAATLNQNDTDFGAGGPVALPDSFGTPSVPRLLMQVGKEGTVYLLNRDSLGGFMQGAANGNAVVASYGPFGGVWGRPGVWPGDGGFVYSLVSQGRMIIYQRGVDGSGNPTLSRVALTADTFGFGAGSAIVTSNGTTSGSALVWVTTSPQSDGVNGELRAYDAVPVGGILPLRFRAPVGTTAKFTLPGVANGAIYVGTRDGHVVGFGSPVIAPLRTNPLDFGSVVVGQSSTQVVNLTANQAVTITALSSTDPQYTVGAVTPALPRTLNSGDTLTVNVTFAPTSPGPQPASFVATTSAGTQQFPMAGTGQALQPTLVLTPTSLNLGSCGIGNTLTGTFSIGNVGAQPLTIDGFTLPEAPYSVTGLPALGTMIGTGQSVTATVTFAPTASGTFSGAFSVTTNGGNGSVALSASAAPPGHLVFSTLQASAGSVPIGSSALASFTLTNDGGSAVTITKSKPPTNSAFAVVSDIPEGTTIAPGAQATGTMRFTPTALGLVQDIWVVNGNDGSAVQNVGFEGTGIAPVQTIPPPSAGGWTLNGNATMSGGTLVLTPARQNNVGSSYWPTTVSSQNLTITFDTTIGGGSGGDGIAFIFANPAAGATPQSLGANGTGLGFGGVPGIAVAIDTFGANGNPSNNFVGVSDGATRQSNKFLHWVVTNTNVPPLRTTRHITVTVNQGALSVKVDGNTVINTTVTLPPNVLLGFSAACGGSYDRHAVSNVSIGVGSSGGGGADAGAPGDGGTDAKADATDGATDAKIDATDGATDATDGATDAATDAKADADGATDAKADTTDGNTTDATADTTDATADASDGTASADASDGAAPGGRWQLNGFATTTPTGFQLTDTGGVEAGSVFWTQPYSSSAITAIFDISIGGGNVGADGMTIAFMDPVAQPTALGPPGGSLGFPGTFPGIGVAFDTFNNGNDPSSNFIGITDGFTGGAGAPHWVATTSAIPDLRSAPHRIVVTLNAGTLSVSIDGTAALSRIVSLPPQVLVGFTAGSGGFTDRHAVDNISISAQAPVPPSLPDPGAGDAITSAPDSGAAPDSGPDSASTADSSVADSAGAVDSGAADSGSVPDSTGAADSTGVPDSTGPADAGADTAGTGTWRMNGTTAATPTGFQLTDVIQGGLAGSVFFTESISSGAFTATFDISIGGGTGADGMTFAIMDPAAGPTALGGPGGDLGFPSNAPGIGVAFDTFNNGNDPSSNFIGITDGYANGSPLHWLATTTAIPELRGAPHHVVVTLNAGTLAVSIDGAPAVSIMVALPSQVLVGFTAGNGGFTDRHAVDNVQITGIQ